MNYLIWKIHIQKTENVLKPDNVKMRQWCQAPDAETYEQKVPPIGHPDDKMAIYSINKLETQLELEHLLFQQVLYVK